MLSKNYAATHVAGFNQSRKQIKNGNVRTAYLACDAEGGIVSEMTYLCESFGVILDTSKSKAELGKLCGIEVDCAVCVILK
ncbi:MAG: ribosomal L7Ae/L30e/S12e/Gadd45 family protein [Clostridia bacterium]|nr:ribosomal L7Ae/L30e/S12e/Gadd45 family protein [Clostridia bacterium]